MKNKDRIALKSPLQTFFAKRLTEKLWQYWYSHSIVIREIEEKDLNEKIKELKLKGYK